MSTNPRVNILLVDDSRSVLSKLKQELGALGFHVNTAPNGKVALECISKEIPDCILSDFEMPEMGGVELARAIKANPEFRLIPFIILTSRDDFLHLSEAIQSGADDFLAKTSSVSVIACKIQAMLRLSAIRREALDLRRLEGIHQIVATYNHEINNPLAIILGHLPHLIETADPSTRPKLEKVLAQVLRIHTIVKKIDEACTLEETNYAGKDKMLKVA